MSSSSVYPDDAEFSVEEHYGRRWYRTTLHDPNWTWLRLVNPVNEAPAEMHYADLKQESDYVMPVNEPDDEYVDDADW